MRIRKLDLSEANRIASLIAEKTGERLEDVKEHTEWHLKGFPEICLAAEEEGRLLGFIICHLHTDSLEIEELYAEKGHEYVFKHLILEVLKRIPKVNTVTIWLEDFTELINQLR